MGPKAQNFHHLDLREDLIDQPVLDIDSPRICTRQIPDEFLERRRVLKGIFSEDFQENLRFRPKPGGGQLLRVLLRLFREDELPAYQASFFDSLPTGVFIPSRIDSRIPGIDRR